MTTTHQINHMELRLKADAMQSDSIYAEITEYRYTDWIVINKNRGEWTATRLQRKDDDYQVIPRNRLVVASNFANGWFGGRRDEPGTLSDEHDRFAHFGEVGVATTLTAKGKHAIFNAIKAHVDVFGDELHLKLTGIAQAEWNEALAKKMDDDFGNFSEAELREYIRLRFAKQNYINTVNGQHFSKPYILRGR
jgi:hypothetical protein